MGAGVRRLYTGMFQRAHDERGNGGCVPKADERSPVAQEHSASDRLRAVVTQIGGKGRAHVGGQRQLGRFPALSAKGNLPRAPIDIVSVQPNDFAGAHAEPGEQQQDHMVPPADGRRSIATRQNTFHRGSRQKPRKRGKRPIGDSGDAAGKIGSDCVSFRQACVTRWIGE